MGKFLLMIESIITTVIEVKQSITGTYKIPLERKDLSFSEENQAQDDLITIMGNETASLYRSIELQRNQYYRVRVDLDNLKSKFRESLSIIKEMQNEVSEKDAELKNVKNENSILRGLDNDSIIN